MSRELIIAIASKLLDFLVVLGTLAVILFKWKFTKKDVSMKDLITQLEEQNRQNEKLRIEAHALRMRHEHLKSRYLHS